MAAATAEGCEDCVKGTFLDKTSVEGGVEHAVAGYPCFHVGPAKGPALVLCTDIFGWQ